MTDMLAEARPVTFTSSPYELIFLGVAVLITLALLTGFIILLVRQRGK